MTMGTYTKVGAVEESSYGVTPASALQLINVSGVKMPRNVKRERPNVLTGDRRRYPTRVLQKSGAGLTLPMPLQYENDLLFLEGLMNGTRGSAVTVTATTISFTATTIKDSANGFTNFQSGDLVYVSGAGVAGNNGWKGPIVKVDAGELTIPAGQVGIEAATESITVQTRRLLDAETLKSYSIEYQLSKLTTYFRNALGQVVKSGKYSWAQGSFATAEFTLQGKVPSTAAATIGTGAATAAKTSGFMNAVDDFQLFKFGGYGTTLNAITVTKWDAMFENILAELYGLGNVGPSLQDLGPFDASVDLSVYMDNNAKDLLAAAEANSTLWVWWALVDPQGNRVAFSLPAVKVEFDDVPVNGAEEQTAIDAKITAHDPAKDSSSTWAANSFGYQAGVYFVPAV